jgi:protein phosphatase
MHLGFAAVTSVGRVRETNQDAVLATAGAARGSYVLAVADGVGGLLDGGEASRLVVDSLAEGARHDPHALADSLDSRLVQANTTIFESGTAKGFPSATTIVLVVIEDGHFEVIHAGDSRAYLWRGGRLQHLTTDHSWVAEQERAGAMTREEAAASQYRNIITRCIGAEPSVLLERRPAEPCLPGDIFLLSSDGLHGLVDEPEIAATLAGRHPVEDIANRLVELANDRGGTDNISAVVARIE